MLSKFAPTVVGAARLFFVLGGAVVQDRKLDAIR
jgi:hypothetical protein